MGNFDTNGDISLEQSRDKHFEEKAYYDRLDDADKRWIDKIRALKVGRYDADFRHVVMLSNMHGGSAISAFSDIFHYGFMKGIRAEQARMKKKANMDRK